jgi:hypothetical protein
MREKSYRLQRLLRQETWEQRLAASERPELVPVADNLAALAGQSFADAEEIESATRVATKQLNGRAKP